MDIAGALDAIPCIGDGDTGYGNAVNLARTVEGYAQAGLGGIMVEDQVSPKRCGHVRLSVCCDSSYGASPKPMYGYVVFANGTPVSWSAKKQKIVPQSSCEAETYALNAGCRAIIFIKNLLAGLMVFPNVLAINLGTHEQGVMLSAQIL